MERQGAMSFMSNRSGVAGLAAVVLGVVCLGPALRSQDQAQNPGQGTGQPARALRLSYVDGQVTLAQGGQVLAQQAVANTPLLEGMQLTTADTGKAEIQFEDGSVARLSPDSSLTLQVLQGAGTTANAVLLLNSGLAYFEFQGGGQNGQMSVQFGDAQLTTSGFTVVRISMDTPPGDVAVFSGNAHLDAASSAVSIDLHGGESVALNGATPSNYQLADSIEPDSWDSWNSDRDQALTTEAASQTAAPANLGESQNPAWNDLDADGNWYDVPNQGYIWSPYEAASADFDPYGYGNWMYTPGYGYLWISGYQWGYMPFQCGAWNYYNNFGWGWAPGMGGCSPWWGLGFYGGPNIGRGPAGYRPIPRPILPRHPINGKPVTMVAINRSPVVVNPALVARNRNAPVTIGGATVVPLRPLPSRPVIVDRTPSNGAGNQLQQGNRSTQPTSGPAAPGGGQAAPNRPGYNQNRPVAGEPTEPTRPTFTPENRPASSPAPAPAYRSQPAPSHDSAPSRPSAPSGGSASHSSGGSSSGGGGGSHSGGGGGGGGGGGSHGGGGGSGHH